VASAPLVDILIPTFSRPVGLAVTLAAVASQTHSEFRVTISDQTEHEPLPSHGPEVEALVRVLEAAGHPVRRARHLPRRGLAEHRQWLLDQAAAPYVLFLDDDVFLERDLVARLVGAIRSAGCGFIGSAVVGLSHRDDRRPHEQAIEFWDGPVRAETIGPGSPGWERHRLHNAANLHHLRERMPRTRDRLYRVAWVGGCVLYDAEKLRAAGGFDFWDRLPSEHAGEDVLAQMRVMARFGGAGLFPSGAYHLEIPTTIRDREVDAPVVLSRLGAA
jgi:glycosyltransferase involved in cell wall biosynthesis